MLKIKLAIRGKKHQRTYRIVVSECRSKLNGKFIDDIGSWNPFTKELKIDKQKFDLHTKNGAKVALGVDKLLNPDKYPKKIKKSHKKSDSEKPNEQPQNNPQ